MSSSPPTNQQDLARSSVSSPTNRMAAKSEERSARELSAAALESARKAKAQDDLKNDLETQIAALRAQQEAAAKSAEQYLQQSKAEEQASMQRGFHEIELEKKESFRNAIADEVFIRVAQALQGEEDRKYMQAVADGRPGFENPTEFKALLWEAIAGNNCAFLQLAAAKVCARYKVDITDADLDQITSSFVCLKKAPLHQLIQAPSAAPAAAEVENEPPRVEAEIDETIMDEPVLEVDGDFVASITPVGETQIDDPIQRDETATEICHSVPPIIGIERIKQELLPRRSNEFNHLSMSELDHEDNEAMPAAHTTTTSTICSPLRSEPDLDDEINVSPSRVRSYNITPNKRIRDDESVASNTTAGSQTPKRARIAGTTKVGQFKNHIGNLAADGKLHEDDLKCTKCKTDVEKDPRITSCLHLYCNKCLKAMRLGISGKAANKVVCLYSACGKEIGKPNITSVETIEDLKTKHALDLRGFESGTEDGINDSGDDA